MAATAPAETSTNYGTDPGDPSRADTVGGVDQKLSIGEVTAFVPQVLARADLDDKRVCLAVPDGTRSCPLPLLRAAHSALKGRAKEVTVVIALGTHQGMSEDHLARHLGYPAGAAEETFPAGPSSITNPGYRRRSPRSARFARSGCASSLVA